jgi:hypothetical protein
MKCNIEKAKQIVACNNNNNNNQSYTNDDCIQYQPEKNETNQAVDNDSKLENSKKYFRIYYF